MLIMWFFFIHFVCCVAFPGMKNASLFFHSPSEEPSQVISNFCSFKQCSVENLCLPMNVF